ncbi:MAG: 2-oxo acid dehydrogenase subunit E2 [Oscillospiraceae bacterium]|nr:2-oxo acid dehydrogenase subunit E2 [Oscillospiraceae bacterium]
MAEKKVYTGKAGFELLHREQFKLQRKIVANMTSEAWETIPHAAGNYEPDATEFLDYYQKLRGERPEWKAITVNTLLLYIITQGLIACPAMNGHITFKRKSANGCIELYKDINISMPMIMPDGKMMTINLHNCEQMSLSELAAYIADVRRRMDNTDVTEAMYEAAFENTINYIKRGRVDIVLSRLLGNMIGKGKMERVPKKARKEYFKSPARDRLTKLDIEQGTVTVSNLGSVYRGSAYAPPVLLDVIPPQLCVIGLGGTIERPGIVTLPGGAKEIKPRKFIPFHLCMDHRALDYGEFVPFMRRLDEIFSKPEAMENWI